MIEMLERINGFVWGVPALLLILGVGCYLTLRTGFLQIRIFPKAIRQFCSQFRKKETKEGGVSSYRAMCTALAATVGTGNLAGVAGAIAIGGPGAVFWMWICAILGMILKFAEASLAVYYRQKNEKGEWIGGPMYMISSGLGKRWKWLASVYCFFGVVAAFGVGNATQINTVLDSVNGVLLDFGWQKSLLRNILIGILMAILVLILLMGGAKRIGTAAEMLVPFASVIYLVLGLGILIIKHSEIPAALSSIVRGAFAPQAVTGGMMGSVLLSLRTGAARGVFTNEAGMGTASIAHAGADVSHPIEQGTMGIIEVFLDTIVICTMTALVILCSGVPIPYGKDVGILLTSSAFSNIYGNWVCIIITAALCLFAFATVLGWGLYGGRCVQYLFGYEAWKPFVLLQGVFVVLGAVMNTGVVWMLSEIINGLMAIPNLIALFMLTPVLLRLIREYEKTGTRN